MLLWINNVVRHRSGGGHGGRGCGGGHGGRGRGGGNEIRAHPKIKVWWNEDIADDVNDSITCRDVRDDNTGWRIGKKCDVATIARQL